MRVITNEELLAISGGDAAATRSGNVNSYGEGYGSSSGRYDTMTPGCGGDVGCLDGLYNLTHP